MYKIQIQLDNFSASHRHNHHYSGICKNLHGHNYDIAIKLGAQQLDEFGFVMDFCKVKELCNNWLEQHWDHGVILSAKDTTLLEFLQQEKQKYFLLPENMPPSCENLTKYAFEEFTKMISQENSQAQVLRVEIWETKHFKAIYEKPSIS
jgi:6-pyruvoyltetrahydropterin/6-carboxytetrahydropterin synthase